MAFRSFLFVLYILYHFFKIYCFLFVKENQVPKISHQKRQIWNAPCVDVLKEISFAN